MPYDPQFFNQIRQNLQKPPQNDFFRQVRGYLSGAIKPPDKVQAEQTPVNPQFQEIDQMKANGAKLSEVRKKFPDLKDYARKLFLGGAGIAQKINKPFEGLAQFGTDIATGVVEKAKTDPLGLVKDIGKGIAETPIRAIATPILSAKAAITGKEQEMTLPWGTKIESFGTQQKALEDKYGKVWSHIIPGIGITSDILLTAGLAKVVGKAIPPKKAIPLEETKPFKLAEEMWKKDMAAKSANYEGTNMPYHANSFIADEVAKKTLGVKATSKQVNDLSSSLIASMEGKYNPNGDLGRLYNLQKEGFSLHDAYAKIFAEKNQGLPPYTELPKAPNILYRQASPGNEIYFHVRPKDQAHMISVEGFDPTKAGATKLGTAGKEMGDAVYGFKNIEQAQEYAKFIKDPVILQFEVPKGMASRAAPKADQLFSQAAKAFPDEFAKSPTQAVTRYVKEVLRTEALIGDAADPLSGTAFYNIDKVKFLPPKLANEFPEAAKAVTPEAMKKAVLDRRGS